ncbi:4150_t:CDS:1, partial [Paraglomus occultum]
FAILCPYYYYYYMQNGQYLQSRALSSTLIGLYDPPHNSIDEKSSTHVLPLNGECRYIVQCLFVKSHARRDIQYNV